MDKVKIGKKLTALRNNNSVESVAKNLGISVSALRMYENGHRIPRDDIKKKIAAYYQKSVQQIFFDE